MLLVGLPDHQTNPKYTTTMSKKRYTKEAQIKAIRHHEAGRSQAEACKELDITTQTFYRWKKQMGMMTSPYVRRLRELEKENKELKQTLADGLRMQNGVRCPIHGPLGLVNHWTSIGQDNA